MLAPIQPPQSEFAISAPAVTVADSTSTAIDANKLNLNNSSPVKIDSTIAKKEVPKPEIIKTKSGYAKFFANIDSGQKVVCFFVPGCDHCRATAKELTEMKKNSPNFPEISIVFMDEEANLIPEFFEFAQAKYPFKIIGVIDFWKILGTGKDVPGVKLLLDGKEIKYYYGTTDNKFNKDEFAKLIN